MDLKCFRRAYFIYSLQASVAEDHPDAVALLAKCQAAQDIVSQIASEKKDTKAARDTFVALKSEYFTLTGQQAKLVKESKAKAEVVDGAEVVSKKLASYCLDIISSVYFCNSILAHCEFSFSSDILI